MREEGDLILPDFEALTVSIGTYATRLKAPTHCLLVMPYRPAVLLRIRIHPDPWVPVPTISRDPDPLSVFSFRTGTRTVTYHPYKKVTLFSDQNIKNKIKILIKSKF